ncbi:MAG: GAF domain-containing protein [Vulcanimicrobiota bacterium]
MNRLHYAWETFILYGLVCLVGKIFNGGNWAFVGSAFHPFILIIALEAVQYGLHQALFAALVGVILYLLAAGQMAGHAGILFSMAVTALLLGLTQEARNRQLRETRSELEEVRTDQERLRQRISVLTAANAELNERILGEVNTVQSFSEIARRLSVLERDDLYPAVCQLIRDYLQATEASFYDLQDGALVMRAESGWAKVPKEAQKLTDGEGLLWEAVRQKRPVTAMELEIPAKADAADPARRYGRLIAAPVLHPDTKEPIGVVSVDRMPFSRFHGASVKILGVVARWAGDSLYNAALFEQLRSQVEKGKVAKA